MLTTIFYCFAAHPFGLIDRGLAAPFATLRSHGGIAHILLLTDIFNRDGGTVRVEYCNSSLSITFSLAKSRIPCTQEREPVGHIAQDFAVTPRRIGRRLDNFEQESSTSYTIATLELRRILGGTYSKSVPFSIENVRLPGTRSDEEWRAAAVDVRVCLECNADQHRTCRCFSEAKRILAPRDDDELANLNEPDSIERKFSQLYFPYSRKRTLAFIYRLGTNRRDYYYEG